MAEIKCSEGVFNSKEELAEYLGRSLRGLDSLLKEGKKSGLSESDAIDRAILCNKVKKEFNLKRFPQYTNIVLFHGKYYPSVEYLSKLKGWRSWVVLDLISAGLSLEEIDLQFKQQGSNTAIRIESFTLLKSKVDEDSKVFVENGEVVIEVKGKKYRSIPDLANDYGISLSCFRRRIRCPGVSICQALDIETVAHHSPYSFSFLGKNFNSRKEFCDFYNLPYETGRYLLQDIDRAENLVKWLYSIVDESNITFNGDLNYLLKISRGLDYNKEDIMYQIQNYANLKEGYTYYLGGKQYKGITEFHGDVKLLYQSNKIKKFINVDKEKIALYKIADMINGVSTEQITYKSPKTYVYIYFYDFLKGVKTAHMNAFLGEIYTMLESGLSALEIKNLLIDYRSLIKSVYKSDVKANRFIQGSFLYLSKGKLLDYFNMNSMTRFNGLQRFLQYSNLKIIAASYRYNSLQYYLCDNDGSLCYLSGNDLLDIAVKSVKEHNGTLKEEV